MWEDPEKVQKKALELLNKLPVFQCNGWKDIRLSSESVGLRSYLKTKLKGSFAVQGGAEWNYMTKFSKIEELKNYSSWQTSALLGLVKSYKIGKKVNGNVQLMYDFLHNQHVPATQPVLFRIGYGLR